MSVSGGLGWPLGPVSCEVASSEQAGLGGSFVVEPVSCELASSEQAGLEGWLWSL